MPFRDFIGNAETLRRLREMMAHGRLPHAILLTGPEGAGKYTLAQMIAKAANCLNPVASIDPLSGQHLPDFCGTCDTCTGIEQADDLDARFVDAVEAHEGLRDADKKDTRILIQTHPAV